MKHLFTLLTALLLLGNTQTYAQCSGTILCDMPAYTVQGSLFVTNFVGDSNTTTFTWSYGCFNYSETGWGGSAFMATPGNVFAECEVCLTLTDSANGCNYTTCDTIRTTGAPNTNPNCHVSLTATPVQGDTVYMVTASTIGNAPFTYNWSVGPYMFDSLSDTVYLLVPDTLYGMETCLFITDNSGCVAADYIVYGANPSGPPPCTAVFVVLPDTAGLGNYVGYNLSYGNYGTDILWDFGDGTTSTDPFPTHQYTTPGHYVLCLTVGVQGTNCYDTYCDTSFYVFKTDGSAMSSLSILSPTGINEPGQNTVRLYPNPVADKLYLEGIKPGTRAIIHNTTGQRMYDDQLTGNSINVERLSAGTYLLHLQNGKQIQQYRFVKE